MVKYSRDDGLISIYCCVDFFFFCIFVLSSDFFFFIICIIFLMGFVLETVLESIYSTRIIAIHWNHVALFFHLSLFDWLYEIWLDLCISLLRIKMFIIKLHLNFNKTQQHSTSPIEMLVYFSTFSMFDTC